MERRFLRSWTLTACCSEPEKAAQATEARRLFFNEKALSPFLASSHGEAPSDCIAPSLHLRVSEKCDSPLVPELSWATQRTQDRLLGRLSLTTPRQLRLFRVSLPLIASPTGIEAGSCVSSFRQTLSACSAAAGPVERSQPGASHPLPRGGALAVTPRGFTYCEQKNVSPLLRSVS